MFRFFRFIGSVFLCLSPWPLGVSLAAEFDLVGREMSRVLQNDHYARLPFNEELSARFFERYLRMLDEDKVYFLASEVEDLRSRYGRNLHDHLSTRTFMPIAREFFEVYRSRVFGRVSYVKALLELDSFDFTQDRVISRERESAEWAVDGPALQRVWRDLLEDGILSEMVRRESFRARARQAGQRDPFRDALPVREKVALQYDRLLKGVTGANEEDVANYFLSAVANAYDPHTEYYSEGELRKFKIGVSNELVGIGVHLSMNDQGETEISGIVNGGPIDLQGELKLGDRLVAISPGDDGEWIDIIFQPIDKTIEYVVGEEGAAIGLRVKRRVEGRKDLLLEVSLSRAVVTIKDDLATAMIYDYGGDEEGIRLGVITIPSFYFDYEGAGNRVSVDVERLLRRLKSEGVDGLVLDLRDNAGGALSEVQRLTGFFISRGPVVQVKSVNGQVSSLNSFHRKPLYGGPLVVLTNRGSASATEILAAALQDYQRAVVVGSATTYGKGTVQRVINLADVMPIFSDRDRAGSLKLTIQKYYRVSGSSVQLKGVVPDVIFPDLSDAYELGERYQKYPLPHDVIIEGTGLKVWNRDDLHLEVLRMKSAQRLENGQYFRNLRSDIDRAKAKAAANEVSLNLKARLTEAASEERRRELRVQEQLRRFARIEGEDQRTFRVFHLTLDDLGNAKLRPLDQTDHSKDHVRELTDELSALEKNLKWPSGMDAIKREALSVLRDLVMAKSAEKWAIMKEKE